MKYEGDINDLVTESEVAEQLNLFVIRFNGKIVTINSKKFYYLSKSQAKSSLKNHVYANFCQGHYWHKNKNNTFSIEKGWDRNNGNVLKSAKEFKIMAKKLTEYLLEQKIFTIESLIIK